MFSRFLTLVSLLGTVFSSAPLAHAADETIDPERAANLIILDEIGVANLGIETALAEEVDFETTVFAIGRVEEIPANRSVVSSRISGRVIEVFAFEGDLIRQGQPLLKVESRQPGNPPPTVTLKASQAGMVVDSHVRLGQPVEPENELMDISDRSEVWAVAKIPEQDAAGIEVGTTARIRVPALGGEAMDATLIRFGVVADREAGTVEGIFQLANVEGTLRPGMRAEFSIITEKRSEVMAVPRIAIQGDPIKRVVFVRDFELPTAFLRAPVILGEQNDEFVEILGGLFPGDEVVTHGSYSLGFADGGSGISLKEALDAAHGHEHNEDGSEISEDQKADHGDGGHDHGDHSHGHWDLVLMIYAGVISILFLAVTQTWWKQRQARSA